MEVVLVIAAMYLLALVAFAVWGTVERLIPTSWLRAREKRHRSIEEEDNASALGPACALKRDSAANALREQRHADAQRLELELAWLETQPPRDQLNVPQHFDLKELRHVKLIEIIRERYGALLEGMEDTSGSWGRCMYKPSSLLPFPKPAIREALERLLDVAEGRATSPHLDLVDTEEWGKAVRNCIFLLDTYLDAPPEKVPTDPGENFAWFKEWST